MLRQPLMSSSKPGISSYSGSTAWMIDWWYMQVSTDKGINAFCNLVSRHKPVRWFNEGGLIDKAIKPAIIQSMRLRNTWVALESLPSMADKTVKLQSFHARASAGTGPSGAGGNDNGSTVVNLEVEGQPVTGTKVALGNWGQLTLGGQAVDRTAPPGTAAVSSMTAHN